MAKTARIKTPSNQQVIDLSINLFQLEIPAALYTPSTGGKSKVTVNESFVKKYGTEKLLVADESEITSRRKTKELFKSPGLYEQVNIQTLDNNTEVDIEIIPIHDQSLHQSCMVLIRDLSAKRNLEKQMIDQQLELLRTHEALVQAAKLASLGELSSGLAHELNQPLQTILGFGQEIKDQNLVHTDGKMFLDEVIHAGQKMKELISTLRSFARNAGTEKSIVSVNHVISEAVRITKYSLLENQIEIDWQSSKRDIQIYANQIQIEQIFVNLITNARDATLVSGKNSPIKIRTQIHENTPEIWITDEGVGMDQETCKKIFDPFFTTKPVGQGTGIGLSIVHSIAQKNGIEIQVKSKPGKGTSFILKFQQYKPTKEKT